PRSTNRREGSRSGLAESRWSGSAFADRAAQVLGLALLDHRRRGEPDVVQLVADDLDRVVRILVQVAFGVQRERDDARAHERQPLDRALEVAEDVAGLAVMD